MNNIESKSVEEPVGMPTQDEPSSSHRIPVVVDDRDIRQLSIEVLTKSGFDVETAPDGAAAWEAL